MKKTPSGDQARSYTSEPEERHMCLIRHVSLSSIAFSPNTGAAPWSSEGTHNSVLPSSPAVASISPDTVQTPWLPIGRSTLTTRSETDDIDCLCVLHRDVSKRLIERNACCFEAPPLPNWSDMSLSFALHLSRLSISVRCCRLLQWLVVPCHEVQSGPNIWECSHCATISAAEKPSWYRGGLDRR